MKIKISKEQEQLYERFIDDIIKGKYEQIEVLQELSPEGCLKKGLHIIYKLDEKEIKYSLYLSNVERPWISTFNNEDESINRKAISGLEKLSGLNLVSFSLISRDIPDKPL